MLTVDRLDPTEKWRDCQNHSMCESAPFTPRNEGPSVVERYCQNEAFMNKLRQAHR